MASDHRANVSLSSPILLNVGQPNSLTNFVRQTSMVLEHLKFASFQRSPLFLGGATATQAPADIIILEAGLQATQS